MEVAQHFQDGDDVKEKALNIPGSIFEENVDKEEHDFRTNSIAILRAKAQEHSIKLMKANTS